MRGRLLIRRAARRLARAAQAELGEALVQWDHETGAAYCMVGVGEVARTVSVSDSVYVDLDEHGRVIGVEDLSGFAR